MAPGGTITIHVQYYINNTHDPTLDTSINVGAIMVYEANIPVPSGYRIQSTSPALPVQMNDGDILSVYIAVRTSGSGYGNATIVQDTPEERSEPEELEDDGPLDDPGDIRAADPILIDWKALTLIFLFIVLAVILFTYRRIYGDKEFDK